MVDFPLGPLGGMRIILLLFPLLLLASAPRLAVAGGGGGERQFTRPTDQVGRERTVPTPPESSETASAASKLTEPQLQQQPTMKLPPRQSQQRQQPPVREGAEPAAPKVLDEDGPLPESVAQSLLADPIADALGSGVALGPNLNFTVATVATKQQKWDAVVQTEGADQSRPYLNQNRPMFPVRPGARSWSAIVAKDDVFVDDPLRSSARNETDPFLFTSQPSSYPSAHPSPSPSEPPSKHPSTMPSWSPTLEPSQSPSKSMEPSSPLPTANPTSLTISPKPTVVPTNSPTSRPSSSRPTEFPTFRPTTNPTLFPTSSPTIMPSHQPTTPAPTKEAQLYPQNAVPSSPPRSYFNYDKRGRYGPGVKRHDIRYNKTHSMYIYDEPPDADGWRGWGGTKDMDEVEYWGEFEKYLDDRADLDDNICNDKKAERQSPIDVRDNGGECLEYHEVRSRPGDYGLRDGLMLKQILPSKLRLVFPRRTGEEPDPPSADIPKGWGDHLDAVHVDVKVPSEHLMNGRRFAAEYQLYHIQKDGRGVPAISVLIDLDPSDADNEHFQLLLNEWKRVFDKDKITCALTSRDKRRRMRRLGRYKEVGSNGTKTIEGEDEGILTEAEKDELESILLHEEQLQQQHQERRRGQRAPGSWDPYDPSIIVSPWFYGYEGSLTEPPCSEFVSWRVIDEPMLISKDQLRLIKTMLFNHIDGECRRTSVHFRGSVARPVQDTAYRPVYRCTCRDFIGDKDREWYGRNRCWEGEEIVFHDWFGGANAHSVEPKVAQSNVFHHGGP